MLTRLTTRAGKDLLRLRASTVEPVLGSLITCYSLRQISQKHQAGATKVMYLAAIAYNLNKYGLWLKVWFKSRIWQLLGSNHVPESRL